MSKKKKVLHQKVFINDCLDDPLFKNRLRKHEKNTKVNCMVCAKTIMLFSTGISALNRSQESKETHVGTQEEKHLLHSQV